MTIATAPRPAAISVVLARSNEWVSARRKSDGKPFFFVPGSKDAVYMTAVDGCTCPAAQRSVNGDCKHQAAVRQHAGTTVAPAPKARPSYADLFPKCRTCDDIAEGSDGLCYHCGAEAVYRQDQARKRELVAAR